MRLLFATHALDATGATTALLDAAVFMQEKGHSVAVCTPDALSAGNNAFKSLFEKSRLTLISHFGVSDYDAMVSNPVFCHEAILQVRGALSVLGWVHEAHSGVRMALQNNNIIAALNNCSGLVFPSPYSAQCYRSFLSGYPQANITVIPYAVRPASDGPTAEKLPGKIRIVLVGSLSPRKHPGDLVKAIAALNNPAVECLLIGSSYPLDPDVEQIIQQNPKTFMRTGVLEPAVVQAIFKSADIFCLPSEDESFAIAPQEAAMHGIPVILSDLDCYAGAWRHGINCLMQPVGDVGLLNFNLQALIASADLRNRIGKEGKKLVRKFTRKRFTALFDVALDDAIVSFQARRGV